MARKSVRTTASSSLTAVCPRDGRYIEKIGAYNPLLPKDNEGRVIIDLDKAREWMKKGAKPTDRVARFLGDHGVLKYVSGNNPQKAEPGEKAKERAEAKAAKLAEAQGASEEAASEETASEETVAEEGAGEEAPAEETPSEE